MLFDTRKIQNATDTAFRTLKGLSKEIRFHRYTGAAYIASSSGFSGSSFETTKLRAITNNYRREEVDNVQVLTEDRQVFFPASVIARKAPTLNDKVEMDGSLWTIIRVEVDPADSLYTLQVRH